MNTELRGLLNALYEMQDTIRKLLPDTPQRKRIAIKLADAAAIIAVAGRDIAVEQLDKEDTAHTRAVAFNNEKEVSA